MKILFISDVSIERVIGGAERALCEQAIALKKRGHDVHILTRRLPKHQKRKAIVRGVIEWRYNVNQTNAFAYLLSTIINSYRLFNKITTDIQFDCINIHQPFSALGSYGQAHTAKARRIYTCHSFSFEEYISRNKRRYHGFKDLLSYRLNVLIRKWIEKRALNSAETIVVLSRYSQYKLEKFYNISAQKIRIIPGGVDTDRFKPAESKQFIRRRYNIPAAKTVLLTIRNLVPRMGLENLITAFARVAISMRGLVLIIGGDGELKSDLVSMAARLRVQQNVIFTGYIPEEQLADYFALSDLFVLPTKELEGFGLVTVEALSAGVPVVGTPVGGTLEILNNFDPSFLFKDTSIESIEKLLKEKIELIKTDPAGWKKISMKGRALVESEYTWEKNTAALERLMTAQ